MYDKFNPNYYAHLEDDSAMIQAAVDAAAEYGEAVTIPRYNERTRTRVWNICRAIMLHTGSVIYLDNCHLRQADGINTCIFRNSNSETLKGCCRAGRQSNISIIGKGNCLLDGGQHTGATEVNYKEYGLKAAWDNSMINFINVEKVKIQNLNITHHRYWSMVFHYSSHVQIQNIDFYGPYHWRNQDGIDLRNGCSHFLIENLTGVTGDDVVALTNLRSYREDIMKDCRYDDSIHNVVIRNIRCTTRNSFVRILNHGGRKIYNVLIQNLMFDCESDPTDPRPAPGMKPEDYVPIHPEVYKFSQDYGVRIGTCDYYGTDSMAQLGDTYNITVQNITCRGLVGVCLACTAKDVLIENVRMYAHGGTAVYFAQGPMRNIQVRDVYFAGYPKENFDDRLYECELEMNNDKDFAALSEPQACAVYFKDSDAEDIVVRDIHAGKGHTSVFGGYGKARVKVEGLTKPREDMPTNAGVGDIQVVEV